MCEQWNESLYLEDNYGDAQEEEVYEYEEEPTFFQEYSSAHVDAQAQAQQAYSEMYATDDYDEQYDTAEEDSGWYG